MPVRSALYPLLALGCACAAGGEPATAQTTLPGGGSDIFRARMTDWSAPERRPVLVPPRARPDRVAMPRLSSRYGYRTDPIHGTGRMHYGLDIPGPPGTPVLASGAGLVAFAGPAGSYGQMIEIDHGGGLRTRYAHLSRLLVRSGDHVSPREAIALMGSTGRSTGSHLHFEVRVNGRPTDPVALLGRSPDAPDIPRPTVEAAPHISDFARRHASVSARKTQGAQGW